MLEGASVHRLLQLDLLSASIGRFFPSPADGGEADEVSAAALPTMTGELLSAGAIASSVGSTTAPAPTRMLPPCSSSWVLGDGVLEGSTEGEIEGETKVNMAVVFRDCLEYAG